jgi:hypothetical protein
MIQLHLMRIALKHFIYKINAVESDKCACGEESQMPKYVLLRCETFGTSRREFFNRLHEASGLKELTNYDTIVLNPLATRYVAKFMHQTGLLAQI